MTATATIRPSTTPLNQAKLRGKIERRRPADQLEYWAQLAQCALDNPDLSINEIKDTLIAKAEVEAGLVSDYQFHISSIRSAS